MTPERFVELVKEVVHDGAVTGTLQGYRKPVGRWPSQTKVDRCEWFNALGEKDRQQVAEVVYDTAYAAVFHFLVVLDGMTAMWESDEPVGRFELDFVTEDFQAFRINREDGEMLHDMFHGEVLPPAWDQAYEKLRSAALSAGEPDIEREIRYAMNRNGSEAMGEFRRIAAKHHGFFVKAGLLGDVEEILRYIDRRFV